MVELTSFGKWVVQRFASRVTPAPVVGTLRTLSAAELLATASDIPEAEARGEIDAWIDHRGERAALELVEALRTADDTGRGLGFRALLRIGPDAAAAVSRLAGDPELAPYVTVWRIDTLTGTSDDMDCSGDPEQFVRLLGAVIELWGPAAAVSGWAVAAAGADGLHAILNEAWLVERPETEQVLAAIGSGHPDKRPAGPCSDTHGRMTSTHRSNPSSRTSRPRVIAASRADGSELGPQAAQKSFGHARGAADFRLCDSPPRSPKNRPCTSPGVWKSS